MHTGRLGHIHGGPTKVKPTYNSAGNI